MVIARMSCLSWKSHTDSKRLLVDRGKRTEHIYCSPDLTKALPREALGLSYLLMECSDKYSIKAFPLSITERAPVFKDLCFALFTSNSFLVNNCRISKKTRARLLPNLICFLKVILKIVMFALSLSSFTRGRSVSHGLVFLWSERERCTCPHSSSQSASQVGGLRRGWTPRPRTLAAGCFCNKEKTSRACGSVEITFCFLRR